jgi:hypothetical protein
MQHVPSGHDRELHENVWTQLAANSFFVLLVVFLVGVAALLVARRARGVGGPVRESASPGASTAATT